MDSYQTHLRLPPFYFNGNISKQSEGLSAIDLYKIGIKLSDTPLKKTKF